MFRLWFCEAWLEALTPSVSFHEEIGYSGSRASLSPKDQHRRKEPLRKAGSLYDLSLIPKVTIMLLFPWASVLTATNS
jgi:hypothetical protein